MTDSMDSGNRPAAPFWLGPVRFVLQIVRIIVVVGTVLVTRVAIQQGGLAAGLAILGGILALAILSWLLSKGLKLLAADAARDKPSHALAIFKLVVGLPLAYLSLVGLDPQWPVGLLPAGYLGLPYAIGFAALLSIGLHCVLAGTLGLAARRPPVWLRTALDLLVLLVGVGQGPALSEKYRTYERSVGKLPLHEAPFGDYEFLAFAPQNQGLFLIDNDGKVERWDFGTTEQEVLKGPDIGRGFWRAEFSPDRRYLAWSRGSQFGLLDLTAKKDVIERSEDTDCLAIDHDSKTLARGKSKGPEPGLELWDIAAAVTTRTLPLGSNKKALCLAFHPDGKRLYSAGEDGKILVWDLASGEAKDFASLSKSVFHLKASPDGQLVAACGSDPGVTVFNADSGEQVTRFMEHGDDSVYALEFSSTGRQIVSIGGISSKSAIAWDARTGKSFYKRSASGVRYAVALSSDDKLLATSGEYHAYVFDVSGVWPRE